MPPQVSAAGGETREAARSRAPMVRALALHATWRCQDSGVCCSSGWPIPIDAVRRTRIDAAVREARIRVPAGVRIPDVATAAAITTDTAGHAARMAIEPAATDDRAGAHEPGSAAAPATSYSESEPAHADLSHADVPDTLLGVTPDGRCQFHDAQAGRCGVQRALGHEALPLACRMFPRVCLTDTRGVRVSLSHHCPSAAARLFDAADDAHAPDAAAIGPDPALAIVDAPPSFPEGGEYDGLDARGAFPPLLRPGVLLDWETADALERFGVAGFADSSNSAEAACARFASVCERLRGWRVSEGPLIDRLHAAIAEVTARAARAASAAGATSLVDAQRFSAAVDAARRRGDGGVDVDVDANAGDAAHADSDIEAWTRIVQRDAEVRASVPAGVACAAALSADQAREAFTRYAVPVWTAPAMAQPVRRYLAARLFGGWCWYQGAGLRSLVRSLDAALSVLKVEAARQGMATGRMLERNDLREAIRQADLLGLHLAARDALAVRWGAAEREELRP